MTHNLDDLATDILYHGGKPVSFYVALHGKDALIAADQDSAAAEHSGKFQGKHVVDEMLAGAGLDPAHYAFSVFAEYNQADGSITYHVLKG